MFRWMKRTTQQVAPAVSSNAEALPDPGTPETDLYNGSYRPATLGEFIQSCSINSIDDEFFSIFKKIYVNDASIAMSFREMWNLYRLGQTTASIPGDIAELGVYKGGSAKLLCHIKGPKTLHLFDTFSGLPQVDTEIENFEVGQIKGDTCDQVTSYLSDFPGVSIYPGMFPDTAAPCRSNTFSLVNLDADTYSSTRDALEFFYPRMSRSGTIVAHDYRALHCPGVRKAVDEFFADKPELPVELWDTQVVIVKH